jgi:hypothetical protein
LLEKNLRERQRQRQREREREHERGHGVILEFLFKAGKTTHFDIESMIQDLVPDLQLYSHTQHE